MGMQIKEPMQPTTQPAQQPVDKSQAQPTNPHELLNLAIHLARSGKPREALAILKQLPKEMRIDGLIDIVREGIAKNSSPQWLAALVERYCATRGLKVTDQKSGRTEQKQQQDLKTDSNRPTAPQAAGPTALDPRRVLAPQQLQKP